MQKIIEFPVEFGGETKMYNAELVILGMGDVEKKELKVTIEGAEVYFDIDKDKEFRASVISSGKDDPNVKRVKAIPRSLIDAVLKSLQSRLLHMAENPLLPKQRIKSIHDQGLKP